MRLPFIVAAVVLLLAPAAADARFTATAPDAGDGPPWAARAWIRPPEPGQGGESSRCLQIGQVAGDQLVRRFADGSVRPLGPRDRVVCGELRGSFTDAPLIVERYADSAAAPAELTRTVIAGVVRPGIVGVRVAVRGERPRPVRIQGSPRTFLAVLPGTVRRRDVQLRFRTARGRERIVDFTTGRVAGDGPFRPVSAGSTRSPLVLPDPTGAGPPLALTAYRIDGELCVEPGRRVAGETGSWSPEWGTFADAPTLVATSAPEEGDWQPAAPTPPSTNGCTDEYAERSAPYALVVRRVGPGLLAVAGVLRAGESGVALTGPAGEPVRVAIRGRLFLAAVRVTETLGERLTLTIARDGGRPLVSRVATGEQDLPQPVESAEVREGGRVVRVGWLGGFEPFVGVDVARRADGLRVTALQRHPPDFSPEGMSYVIEDIGIPKCADVELPDALVGVPVRPPRSRDVERPAAAERTCVRVRPDERIVLPPDGSDPGAQRSGSPPLSPFR